MGESIAPVQRRLLLPLAALLLLLVGGFVVILIAGYRDNMERAGNRELEATIRQLEQVQDRQSRVMAMLSDDILARPGLGEALKAGDRQRLLAELAESFARFQRDYDITHLYFTGTDGVTLLRLHDPRRYGDRVGRVTLREAMRTGVAATGLEQGPPGILTLRRVTPVFDAGRVEGYLELGTDVSRLLRELQRPVGVQWTVILHGDAGVTDEAGLDGTAPVTGKAEGIGVRVIYSSFPGPLPTGLVRLLETHRHNHGRVTWEVEVDGRPWQVKLKSFPNAAGALVGDIIVVRDVADAKHAFDRLIAFSIAGASLVSLTLLGFLYLILRRVDWAIRREQAEGARSRERLDLAMSAANAGVWDWTLIDNRMFFDERFYTMAGYAQGEFPATYEEWAGRVHRADLGRVEREIEQVRAGKVPVLQVEYRFLRREGEYMWVRGRGGVVRDGKGSPVRLTGIHADITEQKEAEQRLHDRLGLEMALARVSTALAQANEDQLDTAIDEALGTVGGLRGAQRSYLFQLDDTGETFSNSHEWCAQGVTPQKPELQRVPTAQFDAAFSRFRAGEVLNVAEPEALPDELSPLREFMQRSGIGSLINVPVQWQGRLRGVVGFDSEGKKGWPEDDIRLLRTVGDMIGWSLASQESSRRIREHTWFLENLDRVSRMLTAHQETEALLQELTGLILDIFQVDRAWLLWPCNPEAATYQIPFESTRPECPGFLAKNAEGPMDELAAGIMRKALTSDQPLEMQVGDTTGLPDYLQALRFQSQMTIALHPPEGEPWLLGVHQCAHARVWSPVEKQLFRTISERVTTALSRSLLLGQVRQSERRLLESERIALTGTWELDASSGRAFWSDQEYRCLGYAPGACEPGYANFNAAVHPEDREWVNQSVQAALKGDLAPYDIEHRVIWADGSEHVVHERGVVERDANGQPLRMIGTTQDVTERVRIKRELEMHRKHLEQLVAERTETVREQAQIIDQTHDSVVTTELDGFVSTWNGGAERLFGISAEEAIGRHISFVYPERSHGFLERGVFQPLKANGVHEMETVLCRADGSEFPAHLSLSMLRDDRGAPRGMVGYFIDLSELKQREKELDHLATRLSIANRELESFAYSVSHDLRAPLRAIDGFSLALMDDYGDTLDGQGLDYLRRVREATQRMGMLIDDLLQLSRMSRREMRVSDVDLGEIASSILDELQSRDPQRRVEFTLGPDLKTRGDAGLLRVLLDNLLGNAWKFTAREPITRIHFDRKAQAPEVFFICDNGVGFDMRYADKLFGAFQRLHGLKEFPGTGVGLATVQRIVHRHGGRIWAEARPGEGASFYFCLEPTTRTTSNAPSTPA